MELLSASKTLHALMLTRPWIAYIDDERGEGNSIIVTLATGFYFADEPDCGVRGFETVSEVRRNTTKKDVVWREKGVREQGKRGQGAGWKDHGPGAKGFESVTKV